MKTWTKTLVCITLFVGFLATAIGYAAITDQLSITGTAGILPPEYDIYIKKITPSSSAGVTVNSTNETTMFASVSGSGTATFVVDVVNVSDKVYVFERVIDGAETGIEGVYAGSDIQYTLSGISALDEISPNGGIRSFSVTITVPRGVTADNYALIFKFVEKTGTEILPGNDEYEITFQYDNGQPDLTIEVHANELIPRPEIPQKSGYDFIGWYRNTALTLAWNFDVDRVFDNMTLYAGWERSAPTEYVVTFKPNNGDQNMVTVVAAGALVPRPEKPAMEGYEFAGWYTDESCTTAWNFDTDKVSANMILYGKWEVYVPPVPPELNITFDPNIPDQDETSTIVVMTGDYIPRPENPGREGYVFIGWYRDESCTTAWNFEVDKPEYHMTLYGGWEIEEIPEIVLHTITFRPNNGADNSIITVEDGALIPAPAQPEREGYTFTGWYTDEGCTVAWNLDTDRPVADMTLYGGWKKQESSGQEVHSDFLGLVEALLSTNNNCLNNSNVIFNAVQASWSSGKRPETHAPILHCGVNSISGGTMSSVAEEANAKLTSDLSFIFEVDPDPAYRNSRMRLYMYYTESCEDARDGDQIMVYQQIVTRGADGVWYADGTYIGKATVGNYFGGGNAGKRVKTISPYTWTYGYP